MSYLKTESPPPQLRWWKRILRPDPEGVTYTVSGEDLNKPGPITMEFPDGLDEEITEVAHVCLEQRGSVRYILVLSTRRPTSDPSWKDMGPVLVVPPDSKGIHSLDQRDVTLTESRLTLGW